MAPSREVLQKPWAPSQRVFQTRLPGPARAPRKASPAGPAARETIPRAQAPAPAAAVARAAPVLARHHGKSRARSLVDPGSASHGRDRFIRPSCLFAQVHRAAGPCRRHVALGFSGTPFATCHCGLCPVCMMVAARVIRLASIIAPKLRISSRTLSAARAFVMIENQFPASGLPTLGVELELQLVDASTMMLRCGVDSLLAELSSSLAGSVTREFHSCCVEVSTDVCGSVDEVRRDLKAKLAGLRAPLPTGVCYWPGVERIRSLTERPGDRQRAALSRSGRFLSRDFAASVDFWSARSRWRAFWRRGDQCLRSDP